MNRSLTARLRGHVPGELDGAGLAWWAAPRSARPLSHHRTRWQRRWRPGGRWRRDAELAEIVGGVAVLVALGRNLPSAVQQVVEHGRGAVVDDLTVVEGWMRDGLPAHAALRRWSGAAACDAVGRLAAAAAGPPDDVVARLDELAAALRQRAHDGRMAALGVVSHAVWLVSLLAGVVAVATVA